jgi:hypothetical protein
VGKNCNDIAMNLKQLKKLVFAGESENLEFKNSTGQRTAAMKAVCAMLNSPGGFVLFGVTDEGELRGQDVNAGTMETISAELNRIDPPAFPDIETVTLENGKSVIALRVPSGGGLYTYDGRPYIRTGPTTRVMPREEYERRLMDRLHSTRRWENEPVPGARLFVPTLPELQIEPRPELQPESQPELLRRSKAIHLLANETLSRSEISKKLDQKAISWHLNKVMKGILSEGAEFSIKSEKPKIVLINIAL